MVIQVLPWSVEISSLAIGVVSSVACTVANGAAVSHSLLPALAVMATVTVGFVVSAAGL